MRSAGVYLIQAELGTIRNAVIPPGDILITLRIGRSSASLTHSNPQAATELYFGTVIQLNVDSSALDTQRCSISFTGNDKKTIGIALISLPKDKSLLQNTFRFTQNEDKRAEVEVKVKISPFEVTSKGVTASQGQSMGQADVSRTSDGILPKSYSSATKIDSNNNPQNGNSKSKISEEYSYASSQDRKTPKNFKVREENRVVQTTQSEIKRYREEKEAYYQLYQIEKAKNEVAAKFISNVIKKIGDKHPSLLSVFSETAQGNTAKKVEGQVEKKQCKPAQQDNTAIVSQLEQANRSLHRQVEEYKRMVDQLKSEISRPALKGDIPLSSKASNQFLLPGIFDNPPNKSALKQRSNINLKTASAIKQLPQEKPTFNLSDIDFKKWIELSISQREQIQGLLGNLAPKTADGVERNEKMLKKLKASLDKSFASLIGRKEVTKEALMAHKKEVNRCFEQAVTV